LDTIQRHYQVINNYFKNIYEKEREYFMARSKFQEFIVWRQKLNVPGIAHFSQYEQIKGEMDFKVWKTILKKVKGYLEMQKRLVLMLFQP
jgi:hypothetical protein